MVFSLKVLDYPLYRDMVTVMMDVMFKCLACGETKLEDISESEPGFVRKLAKSEFRCQECKTRGT